MPHHLALLFRSLTHVCIHDPPPFFSTLPLFPGNESTKVAAAVETALGLKKGNSRFGRVKGDGSGEKRTSAEINAAAFATRSEGGKQDSIGRPGATTSRPRGHSVAIA